MGTLLLKLAGPLQSWGSDSRFTERKTRHEPTKSGIVGLLAAALGRRREDSIADLSGLPIAVRIDQPGRYERDFQTAHTRKYDKRVEQWVDKSLPLSRRYYLSDAVFVVGIELTDELLHKYADAIMHPVFPLFLGRRSCPPADKILLDICPGIPLLDAMQNHPWEATDTKAIARNKNSAIVSCEMLRDRLTTDDVSRGGEMVRDYPISFSQIYRRYEWRTVIHESIGIPNPHYEKSDETPTHDPMSVFEEV